MVSSRMIPGTEIIGKILHLDVLKDEIKLKIAFQSHVDVIIPKGEIIKKPSLIEVGSIISILRTLSGYYIKTSLNTSLHMHTKGDMG